MPNYFDYVRDYGKQSFRDKPFCDADNVAMCGMYYMPFELIVSDDFDAKPVPFWSACQQLFSLRGNKHKAVGLVLLKNISELMLLMAEQRRYSEMEMVACVNVFETDPDVQFNACTFILPDGKLVVIFRGTDDSLRGWQEDFDILVKDAIPSHKLATDYLEKLAEKYDGDIILCGHSKGGYVAQYGALNCKKEVRDRIKCVYNNDGPGFRDYSYIDTDAYKELLPKYKHFVPQASLVGMLLCHDDDYTVVKSNRISGPLEHDLASWQIEGDTIVTVDELSPVGKFTDLVMYNLLRDLTPEQKVAFNEKLAADLKATGQVGLLDIKNNPIETIKGLINARIEKDPSTSTKDMKGILSKLGDSIISSARSVRSGNYKTVHQRIDEDN